MDAHFIKEIHGNIYEAKVNGIIPWAGIQCHTEWWKPDPNPGTAIRTYEDGSYEIPKAYYYYKQVSRAGRPGMAVVYTECMDSEFSLIGFASDRSQHHDALIITHTGKEDRTIQVDLQNTGSILTAHRTSGTEMYSEKQTARKEAASGENYKHVSDFELSGGLLTYKAPANSVTTFYIQSN